MDGHGGHPDGGWTWGKVPIATTKDLHAVAFANARFGCIVGDLGMKLLYTYDAGATCLNRIETRITWQHTRCQPSTLNRFLGNSEGGGA